jgi:murein DD-endopeptidase MepM/ murein hydrolase activator NlpD
MPRSGYSVVIVPDDTGKVIEKRIPKWKIITLISILSGFLILASFFAIAYLKSNIDTHKMKSLAQENEYLQGRITDLQKSVESIKGRMADIIKTDENIRLMFDLPTIDPSIREVGIGGPDFGTSDIHSPVISNLSLVERDIDKILRQIKLENASYGDVYNKVKDRKHILDHTPSIIPTDGIITSGLGLRKDPFTGIMTMHEGIDIAANRGTPIYAPANGIIERCGWDKGMGNFIVIDHGYNLKTYYGHLQLIKIRKGQKVNRLDILGTIGSTGRSTGPHLHYEVRKYGRPINPTEYFVRAIVFSS